MINKEFRTGYTKSSLHENKETSYHGQNHALLKKTSVIMKVTLFGNMVLTDFIKLEQALVQYSLCPYKNRKRGH